MIDKFPRVLNFNRLFLELNQFIATNRWFFPDIDLDSRY